MRSIVLRSHLALGDIVALTAVPRELARQHPGQFEVSIDTPFPELWANNPHLNTDNGQRTTDTEVIVCHYDRDPIYSVHRSNQHQVHLLTSYCKDVANSLGLPSLYPETLRGDIHLSRAEYQTKSIPHERFNCQRYWIVCAGGKNDFTVKHWPTERFQAVVDHFRGRLQFVQAGATGPDHIHEPLDGVINLVGQTNVRQLIQLVHSSCGVLCGITAAMHLAAAVPLPTWQRRPRPCVVVAGGREPRTWYGYPTHRILETVGTLPCCRDGGCWHARTVPLPDGDNSRLCERVVNGQPKCMTMIEPRQVIDCINQYLAGESIE